MNTALALTPAILSPEARAELAAARVVLEGVSLPVRLAALIGSPAEALRRRLPEPVQKLLQDASRRALEGAMRAVLRSRPEREGPGGLPVAWLHRGLVAASGVAGGAFGLAGTLAELPVSTALILRQIAAEAAAQGEDLTDAAAQAECLKVFALGGRDPADDDAESGYFALRLALAETLKAVAGRGFTALLPSFVAAIATRFGAPVAVKLSAQALPVLGAAAGAAINLAFLGHFAAIARAHFSIRRLERAHGAAVVRAAYDGARDAPFA